jgi:hypothetical protein
LLFSSFFMVSKWIHKPCNTQTRLLFSPEGVCLFFPSWKQPSPITKMLNWDKYYAAPLPSCCCCKRTFVYYQRACVRRNCNNHSARL